MYTEKPERRFPFSLIRKLLHQNGTPRPIEFNPDELMTLLDRVLEQYKENMCALVECTAPINICGDIHGHYTDLLAVIRSCRATGLNKFLFLGDYVDSGPNSLEVITLLFALKLAHPNRMFLLRGNHELRVINKNHGFYSELKTRFREQGSLADDLHKKFNEVFAYMPLAAVVSEKILCMHGGISPFLGYLDDIRNIELPLVNCKQDPLACDLLWADPDIEARGFLPNTRRAISCVFDERLVYTMCHMLNINMIICAHQGARSIDPHFASGRLITVYSASRFQRGQCHFGSVVRVNADLQASLVQLKIEDYKRQMMKKKNKAN